MVSALLALATAMVGMMPGRLVMSPDSWLTPSESREFHMVAAGGIVTLAHAALLIVFASRLWRRPTVDRAWAFMAVAAFAELGHRAIDYVRWGRYTTGLLPAGQLHQTLEVAQLAVALVVVPLVILLARRDADGVPPARIVSR